jgi:nitrogen regulatory protein P-II 1
MKLIVAIIRPDRLNEVLEALYRSDVRGLTVSRVLGHGGEIERVETYRGTTVKVDLQEKVRLEIGVSEPFVLPTVNAILASARTRRSRRREGLRARCRPSLPDPDRRNQRSGGDTD